MPPLYLIPPPILIRSDYVEVMKNIASVLNPRHSTHSSTILYGNMRYLKHTS